jgi:hypothetical protein
LVSKEGPIYKNRHVVEVSEVNLKGSISLTGVPMAANIGSLAKNLYRKTENFQLSIVCLVEFIQGTQRIQPSQRNILRTFGIGFGSSDATKSFLEQPGTRVQ